MSIKDDWDMMGSMERIEFIADDDIKLKRQLIKDARKQGFLR